MPAREASSDRFFARRAIESSPLQLHPKTVSQLCRWGHILLLPQLDRLDAFQLVHGNMHFPCANLIVKQTVLLGWSNAFQGHQNGAESMLSFNSFHQIASSSVAQPLPSGPNIEHHPLSSPVHRACNHPALRHRSSVKRSIAVTVAAIAS